MRGGWLARRSVLARADCVSTGFFVRCRLAQRLHLTLQIGDSLFMHGGLNREFLDYLQEDAAVRRARSTSDSATAAAEQPLLDLAYFNQLMSRWLALDPTKKSKKQRAVKRLTAEEEAVAQRIVSAENSFLWSREHSFDDVDCADLELLLNRLSAKRLVRSGFSRLPP